MHSDQKEGDYAPQKPLTTIATLACYSFFFLNGFIFISWFTVLPEFRDTIGLTDGQLGLVLLGFPIGSLMGMPVTGWLTTFKPVQWLCMVSLFLVCLSQAIATFAYDSMTFFLCFLIMGIGGGSIGVAMNVAAFQTETRFKLTIMSKCHGLFSIGMLIGALVATLLQKAGIFYENQVVYISIVTSLLVFFAAVSMPRFKQYSKAEKPFAFPPKTLWGVGFMAFLALVSEGAMIDWSAIFMKDELNASTGTMGVALIAFTLSMAIVRLTGDRLTAKLPISTLLQMAGIVTILGMIIIVASFDVLSALVGFFVAGAGIAILMPIVVRTASQHPGSPGVNVASVSTVGYFGFLFGPPIMGFLSDTIQLRYALLMIALIGFIVMLLSRLLRGTFETESDTR